MVSGVGVIANAGHSESVQEDLAVVGQPVKDDEGAGQGSYGPAEREARHQNPVVGIIQAELDQIGFQRRPDVDEGVVEIVLHTSVQEIRLGVQQRRNNLRHALIPVDRSSEGDQDGPFLVRDGVVAVALVALEVLVAFAFVRSRDDKVRFRQHGRHTQTGVAVLEVRRNGRGQSQVGQRRVERAHGRTALVLPAQHDVVRLSATVEDRYGRVATVVASTPVATLAEAARLNARLAILVP